MSGHRFVAALLPLLAAGCAIPPQDPFLAAQYALERDDLLRALQAYDAVPVAHPRYPDARAGAVAVEQRVRRCHELILEALVLRGQWRDREALAALRRAQEHWPKEPSIERWIAATEHRLESFGARQDDLATRVLGGAGAAAAPIAEARPPAPAVQRDVAREAAPAVPVIVIESPPSVALAEAPNAVVEREAEAGPPESSGSSAPIAQRPPLAQDPAGLGLVAVEARLAEGELEGAAADLLDLARRHPDDIRVRRRLARLLHQRALLRYGQGAVDDALDDWRRVLELEPDNEAVRKLYERACSERR